MAGCYDLVAILRVSTNDALATLVAGKIRSIGGITDSETLIGFRVHSKHDLERLFFSGVG